GAGIFAYAAAGVLGVAMVATAVQGFGFAWFFPILFAYIQRVVREDQRGRVTSLFVATQEAVGLLGSIAIFVLGGGGPVRGPSVVCGGAVAVRGPLVFRLAAGAAGREPVVVVDNAPCPVRASRSCTSTWMRSTRASRCSRIRPSAASR